MQLGHWTGNGTGVSVVLCPPGTVGSCEVRGGAPATRETALLDPIRTVEHVDAVVLTGGSAFGLATADGVMAWLAERDRGYPTRGGPVPIVPTAAIYDLAGVEGQDKPPGAVQGRLAAEAADAAESVPASGPASGPVSGRVGAGTGATIGKWRGAEHAVAGGLGVATGPGVQAIVVVNAVGDVVDGDGSILAGSTAPEEVGAFPDPEESLFENTSPVENTTLVVIATDAALTKLECRLLAESGHHGLARAISPSHTRYDGDLVIALATGTRELDAPTGLDRLRVAATDAVAEAVRNAVRQT
ncbi:MAG: peptidase S58 family protein [Acidimicrobiia bacterium]|nr:peptidase S58 family protein [Acidimicrobiia bacterium]